MTSKDEGYDIVMNILTTKTKVEQVGKRISILLANEETYRKILYYLTGTFNTASNVSCYFINVYGIPLIIKEGIAKDTVLAMASCYPNAVAFDITLNMCQYTKDL